MRGLVFDKYEGLGNDFLVVTEGLERLSPSFVAELCDRHRGVGGDGVLELRLPTSSERARMVVHNADGSVPEMCGNGLRCVALALARSHGVRRGERFVVETDAGPRGCVVHDDDSVTADVGMATLLGTRSITLDERTFELHEASTGNPHAVTFDDVSEADIERFGLRLATHASFAATNGANIGFARRCGHGALDLVVWERGVGLTQACGTGASAAAAVACALGHATFGEPVRVRLPGGELTLRVDKSGNLQMSGPARFVFHGEHRA